MPPDRVVVAHNGVDSRRFSPAVRALHRERQRAALGAAPDETLLLFVGKGFARKGLAVLLAAIGQLYAAGARGLRLAVVGQGATVRWEGLARELGIADRVRFVGHASDPEAYYVAADVFVLPTFFDPFANATLEAMASGLPVITSRSNGASEILTPGADGLVVDDPRDAAGVARAIGDLMDPARREAMGRAARETALRYTWEGPLQATLDVYARTLGLLPPAVS
jgi:UDP-glucose:(heptosyl)LPS alpha-1,3-glucosyltransferase